jgi:hypothetical protein
VLPCTFWPPCSSNMPLKCIACHRVCAKYGTPEDLRCLWCKPCGEAQVGDQLVHVERYRARQQEEQQEQHDRDKLSFLLEKLPVSIEGDTQLESRGQCMVCRMQVLVSHERVLVDEADGRYAHVCCLMLYPIVEAMQRRLPTQERLQLTLASCGTFPTPNYLAGESRSYFAWRGDDTPIPPNMLSFTTEPTHPDGVPWLLNQNSDMLMEARDVQLFNAVLRNNSKLQHLLPLMQLQDNCVTEFAQAEPNRVLEFTRALASQGLCSRHGTFGAGQGSTAFVTPGLEARLKSLFYIEGDTLVKLCRVVFQFLYLRIRDKRAANELNGPVGREQAECIETKCVVLAKFVCPCMYVS